MGANFNLFFADSFDKNFDVKKTVSEQCFAALIERASNKYERNFMTSCIQEFFNEAIDNCLQRYEMQDGKSSKFWEAYTMDAVLYSRYGRIGNTGQSKEKEFESDDICWAEFGRLVNQKLKKGYSKATRSQIKKSRVELYEFCGYTGNIASGEPSATIVQTPLTVPIRTERMIRKASEEEATDALFEMVYENLFSSQLKDLFHELCPKWGPSMAIKLNTHWIVCGMYSN